LTVRVRDVSAVALFFLLGGCRDNLPAEGRDEPASSGGSVVRVIFSLPGDDIGGTEYRDIMERIRSDVIDGDVGDVAGFGFGMGTMEISVSVEGEGGVEKVERIVRDSYPGAKYRIERLSPTERGRESRRGGG
jgi:hypothetical protein